METKSWLLVSEDCIYELFYWDESGRVGLAILDKTLNVMCHHNVLELFES